MTTAAWITLLAPLASAILITLAGNRLPRRGAAYLATAAALGAFAAAVVSFVAMWGRAAGDRSDVSTAWTWLSAGSFHAGFSILVDPLSVFMMLIVTGVGSLIVAYSVGYMDGSDEERRFFAYMSLFLFSMLLLVQGSNLLLLLAGWGMVGLSSYLLIGYDQHRPAAIAAAKKAFIMNAFGDATMALALFLLIKHTGTLEYGAVFANAPGGTLATLIALGLLGGAVAKSAQLPLQTWLPDAMEGPTPVSALIHAATMVTAGVYLIVRTHPLFELAPVVMNTAALLGGITLVMAGLIALVQNDIKRVIAYSTMSQIGYMFVAAAIGAYSNGMFHLMTHAFFKALLFMAAGILIHALAGEQDIRKLAGSGRLAPFTSLVFLVGSLALVGVPPFAGFFSKDSILAACLDHGTLGYVLFALGAAGTFLTGLYTFRLWFIVFRGEPTPWAREHFHRHHGKEGPLSMLWPVGVLAVLAVVGGWIQFAGFWTPVASWLNPVAEPLVEANGTKEAIASVLAVALGLAGMAIAWAIYGAKRIAVPRLAFVQTTLEHKFFFDELYRALFTVPSVWLARGLARAVEQPLIAGSLTALGLGAHGAWAGTSRAQTGLVRSYVLALAGALGVMVVVFLTAK
jgi:NADH-quinone oxidoreductase subunit L